MKHSKNKKYNFGAGSNTGIQYYRKFTEHIDPIDHKYYCSMLITSEHINDSDTPAFLAPIPLVHTIVLSSLSNYQETKNYYVNIFNNFIEFANEHNIIIDFVEITINDIHVELHTKDSSIRKLFIEHLIA